MLYISWSRGLYVLYKPGNEEVLKKYRPRAVGPRAIFFSKSSELPGLYNTYRSMDHDIYDISYAELTK